MKRRTWLILLGVVAFVSAGLAIVLNVVLASKIAPPEGGELVELDAPDGGDAAAAAGEDEAEADRSRGGGDKSGRPRIAGLDSYMKPIMERSLFDSSKVGSSGGAIAGADGEEQEATDLGATLILTSAAPLLNDRGEHLYKGARPLWDARFSTALILEEGDDAVAQVYLVGDEVGDARIDEIARRRVYVVRSSGAREYLEIGGTKPKKKKGSSSKNGGKKKRGRIDWSEGVTKISDTQYQVDRSSIENALANLDRLSRDARVVPNFVDGKSNGFKVFGIKRNSAYKTLGLKNNDVITGVNGMDLTSPDKALEVYSKLQNESSISLDIVRKGEAVTMEYDIL